MNTQKMSAMKFSPLCLVFVLLCVLLVQGRVESSKNDLNKNDDLSWLVNSILRGKEDPTLEQKSWQDDENDDIFRRPSPNGFSWSSCSKSGDPSALDSLTLSPSPLRLPGNITVAFSGHLDVDLKAPVSLDLKVKKKVLFWIDIPCIDNVGSCNYKDICELIPSVGCPPVFQKYGIPCKCPIKAATYTLPPTDFFVNPVGIPSWLEKGEYEATAKLKQGSQEITCLSMKLSIG